MDMEMGRRRYVVLGGGKRGMVGRGHHVAHLEHYCVGCTAVGRGVRGSRGIVGRIVED